MYQIMEAAIANSHNTTDMATHIQPSCPNTLTQLGSFQYYTLRFIL